MSTKRTPKDEYEYDQQLRREEEIKTEVIKHLKEQNQILLQNQARLLRSLLAAEQQLRLYREEVLHRTEYYLAHQTACLPQCEHRWDSEKGWYRSDPQ